MRSHRLYVPELATGTVTVHGESAHYLGTVRRAALGDHVELFDGATRTATATVVAVTAHAVQLQVSEIRTHNETGRAVHLAPALLKGDKLADIVRPATELGVASIIPLITERADVKVLSPNKHKRLTRIAEEASRQSERVTIPTVHEAVPLKQATLPGTVLVAHPHTADSLLSASHLASAELTIVTGPEGGLTAGEVAWLMAELGATPVRLGATILRAETAPVAALAALTLWNTQ